MQRAIDQLQKDLAASKVAEGRLQNETKQASWLQNVDSSVVLVTDYMTSCDRRHSHIQCAIALCVTIALPEKPRRSCRPPSSMRQHCSRYRRRSPQPGRHRRPRWQGLRRIGPQHCSEPLNWQKPPIHSPQRQAQMQQGYVRHCQQRRCVLCAADFLHGQFMRSWSWLSDG